MGVPVLILDAAYVAPSSLLATLLPQVLGLAISAFGLTLCGMSLFRPAAAGSQ